MFGAATNKAHVPSQWLEMFSKACAARATHPPRQEIIRQTQQCLKDKKYTTQKGETVNLEAVINLGPRGTVKRRDYTPQPCSGNHDTSIRVVAMDCVKAAILIKEKTSEMPVVLNMAAAIAPGCGPQGAQEENLHRRSNLKLCTVGRADLYPIPEDGCLYHPDVAFFRGPEDEGYPFLSEPVLLSVISCAAVKCRPIQTWGSEQDSLTKAKIFSIFSAAAEFKHRHVVLSAFGCGAYRNPPQVVAGLFKRVLVEHFADSFDSVVFAIIEDHNSQGVNGKAFSEAFGVSLETS
eukprot:TRINITY_DN11256_c1_g1_i1.p1 TRINITY_DN11256_c1_g1~~TRINITY_DN11256_c1_g1_i1.p1  ORF type:complete len:300 (+),score=57.54 TRINITY_DN11256_c1_g1_i1:27-902(+)